MLEKPINEITEEDLKGLIENEVTEQKTLEYKQKLPGKADSEKKEFLADISSFANANGGDIIYGVAEENGIPKELIGIDVEDIDKEILRLEEMIRTGIEPRIPNTEVYSIKLSNAKYALIIRIPKSYIGPHWVKFKDHCKFYSRSTKGKYRMDLTELRIAFTLSETIVERARDFRLKRINQIQMGETCLPLKESAKIVFHLIPYSAFYPGKRYDISIFFKLRENFREGYGFGAEDRYNFDGILSYSRNSSDGKIDLYCQIFRNGTIEMVDADMLDPDRKNGELIIPITFEKELIQAFKNYLEFFKIIKIEPPIFIFLSFMKVKGYRMEVRSHYQQYPYTIRKYSDFIDRENLLVPEIFIETYDIDPAKTLQPCFDSIWNACGFPRSLNYDNNGEWIGNK